MIVIFLYQGTTFLTIVTNRVLICNCCTSQIIQSSSSEDEMIASISYCDIRDYMEDTAHLSPSTEMASSFSEIASSTDRASSSEMASPSEISSSLAKSSECHPSACDVQMLREVFPTIDHQKISDTLVASGMDVEEAINKILNESGRCIEGI